MSGFQNWYDTNKDKFNAERRARYAKDKAYRGRVNSYTRRTRSDNDRQFLEDGSVVVRRGEHNFVPCYRMGVTAKKLGVQPHIIRTLEKRELIPMVGDPAIQHFRYYTDYQIELIKSMIDFLKRRRLGQATEDDQIELVNDIQREWTK